ncbi:hypothetical protein PAMP_007733 [Pampus punctatissimus]
MACGVHLGIVLICLFQAEHVCCLWAPQAQSSQRQNSDTYVGFTQQDSGLKRLGGSHLQNQFRQASVAPRSAQSSSLNPGYNQGLSRSGYTQTLSQPAQSGYPSVRSVQSSLVSKPNWRTSLNQFNAQKLPVMDFGLSTSIASGSSVSKFSTKKQNNAISKSSTWPVQQGTSKHLSSGFASVGSPMESYTQTSASHQSAAQRPPRPSYNRQSSAMLNHEQAPRSISPKSSHLFIPRAPAPHHSSVQMQTSATAPGRKVSSKAFKKPSKFSSHHNERSRHNPSKTEAGKPHRSKMFTVTEGEGNYKPTSNTASSHASYNRWNSGFQQPRSLKATTSSSAGTSAQHYAPTKIHSIPQRYGGFSIRRLKGPDQKAVSVWKPQRPYTAPPPPQRPYTAPPPPQRPYTAPPPPQRPYTAPPPPQRPYTARPQQPASYKPQAQSVHPESKWKRIKPQQRLTMSCSDEGRIITTIIITYNSC